MHTHLNCASCIIDDLCGALQLVPLKEKIKNEILKESFHFWLIGLLPATILIFGQ